MALLNCCFYKPSATTRKPANPQGQCPSLNPQAPYQMALLSCCFHSPRRPYRTAKSLQTFAACPLL